MDTYDKRPGTSGISGQLYETKLISLLLFRLLRDHTIEQFCLASNMDDVGAFDDICLKIQVTEHDRPILAFVQAKHKEDDDTFLNFDLIENLYTSYVKVKKKFHSNKGPNLFFTSDFENTDIVFILYTNAKYFDEMNTENVTETVTKAPKITHSAPKTRLPYNSKFADILNKLIATCDKGSQPDCTNIKQSILHAEIKTLAEHFAKFLNDKINQSMNILLDDYMSRYHVLLAQNVVHISEIYVESYTSNEKQKEPTEYRLMTFRHDFLHADDDIFATFRKHLYKLVIKHQAKSLKSNLSSDELVATFLSEPSACTLSSLINTHIKIKNDKLEFVTQRSESDILKLKQIDITPMIISDAEDIHATAILSAIELKVPVRFGNIDLTVKFAKRLDYLSKAIEDKCTKFELRDTFKIVTIDENSEKGILSAFGGLGGAVGNLLVYDEASKFLKFTDNYTLLKSNARAIFDKLSDKINDVHVYRFNIRSENFPKLVFDCIDEADVILSKLVIYDKQGNQNAVGEQLKAQIALHEQSRHAQKFSVQTDTLFITYHHEVQKWWMSPGTGLYLTRDNNIYEQATTNILIEPQITALQNTFYNSHLKYFTYKFAENSISLFASLEGSSQIIISNITILTTVKVIQYLKNKYAVLDLEIILNLQRNDASTLWEELSKTDKVLIVVCDMLHIYDTRTFYRSLDDLSRATEQKHVLFVTNDKFVTVMKEYFPSIHCVLSDELSSMHLTPDSQRYLVSNARAIFQGEEVSLDSLLDDDSIKFIKGTVLNKIICNKNIVIGEELANPNYKKIKYLYIDRKIKFFANGGASEYVTTFLDIDDDIVLVTNEPGTGKSTLLTHLSLETKKQDKALWIVRINLVDYTEQFYKWQNDNTTIDTLETLQFLCRHVIKNNQVPICLKNINGTVLIDNTGDEQYDFELNIFLSFYRNGKLICLFDGFDEICPHYEDKVMKFLEVVKKYPRKNKMWVTTRPYNNTLLRLQRVLGDSYEIEYIDEIQKEMFLNKYWRTHFIFGELSDVQVNNVKTFIDLKRWHCALKSELRTVYVLFYDYLYSHFPHVDDKWARNYSKPNNEMDKLLGRPLLLCLMAEYFVNLMDVGDFSEVGRSQQMNTTAIYDMIIETKLNKVLFQDKNDMKIYNPYIIRRNEDARRDCMNLHKKLAAYLILGNPLFNSDFEEPFDELTELAPFKEGNSAELDAMMEAIKDCSEKTGLICYVQHNDRPAFIHKSFAEYFAGEFICDILRSDSTKLYKKRLLCTILHELDDNYHVLYWLHEKGIADREFGSILSNIKDQLPILYPFRILELYPYNGWSISQRIRFLSSSPEDYVNGCVPNCLVTEVMGGADKVYYYEKRYVVANMKPYLKRYFVQSDEEIPLIPVMSTMAD